MIMLDNLGRYDIANPKGVGTTNDEKLLMYSIVQLIKPKIMIEIGVSTGHMTVWFAAALSNNNNGGKLISVDNWSQTYGGEASGPDAARKRLVDHGLQDIVSFVSQDSLEYLRGLEGGSVDFIWVDGDHSYQHAKDDIQEAYRVAPLVAVHDSSLHVEVRRACMDSGPGVFLEGSFGVFLKGRISA